MRILLEVEVTRIQGPPQGANPVSELLLNRIGFDKVIVKNTDYEVVSISRFIEGGE